MGNIFPITFGKKPLVSPRKFDFSKPLAYDFFEVNPGITDHNSVVTITLPHNPDTGVLSDTHPSSILKAKNAMYQFCLTSKIYCVTNEILKKCKLDGDIIVMCDNNVYVTQIIREHPTYLPGFSNIFFFNINNKIVGVFIENVCKLNNVDSKHVYKCLEEGLHEYYFHQ